MAVLSEVRWGILGCGDVTEKKSGPAFNKIAGSKLVAVMRRDGAKAADYARRHGVAKWYDDAQKLIDDPEVNAVYIATPPGSHCELALKACAAGKACYVEKPMARSYEECLKMIAAFKSRGVPLFVAYYRRALPRFLKAKELVAAGEIGEVIAIEYSYAGNQGAHQPPPWRLQAEHAGAGLFLDLASHLLDALDFIFGPLKVTWSDAKNLGAYDVEDLVVMNFETQTASGTVRGVGEWDFTSDERTDLLLIEGTRGKIEMACFGEGVALENAGGRVNFDVPNPENIQLPMIEQVVRELLGRGKSSSDGESAARTSAVMDAVLKEYYGSRNGEFWRDPAKWPGRAK
jgi:predicted dehydrogenase